MKLKFAAILLLLTLCSFGQNYNVDMQVLRSDLLQNTYKKDSTANALVIYDFGNTFIDRETFKLVFQRKQKIKILTDDPFSVTGFLYFMVCDDKMCLPPEDVPLDFAINGGETTVDKGGDDFDASILPNMPNLDLDNPIIPGEEIVTSKDWWILLLLGFGGGLFALLTPCVFPMIPLTVSFFTKGSENKRKGMFKAIMYGLFILLIYVSLSIPFHFGSDPEVLNEISTIFLSSA